MRETYSSQCLRILKKIKGNKLHMSLGYAVLFFMKRRITDRVIVITIYQPLLLN